MLLPLPKGGKLSASDELNSDNLIVGEHIMRIKLFTDVYNE